jgi:hypothetical protein
MARLFGASSSSGGPFELKVPRRAVAHSADLPLVNHKRIVEPVRGILPERTLAPLHSRFQGRESMEALL